ncbi:MAG: glutathione S-transferase N-terminal domain-containing protein [Novosphingobium sp.]|uniref:glutathione S-transferase N-terminal domain-containing protein n=1 Tax=Novosphingobium sp. TaxID=1874826 RepID=UPI0030160F08
MAFTLINARPSPFGRKVAIALREKGLAYAVLYDVPWGEGTCTPQYSPLEQLPILITEAGENIYDSAYILDWLEAKYPSPALLPEGVDARLEAGRRRLLGERLMEIAQSLIFELTRPQPSDPWVDRQTRKINGGLAALEAMYTPADRQAAPLDLGDLAVATTLLGVEFAIASGLSPEVPVLAWRGAYPALTSRIAALEIRPSFTDTAPALMDVNLQAVVA